MRTRLRRMCCRKLSDQCDTFGRAGPLARRVLFEGRNVIANSQPTARAYLRSVVTDGEWPLLPPPASKRAIAGVIVPMRLATSACVKPARRRARSNSSKRPNSSAWASYAALTPGVFNILFTIRSCVSIFLGLLHSGTDEQKNVESLTFSDIFGHSEVRVNRRAGEMRRNDIRSNDSIRIYRCKSTLR